MTDEKAPAFKKYRVAMVAACPFPANHGSPASIREMSEALVRLGHEVHVVTYPIQEDIPVVGVHIHRVHVPFMNSGSVKVGPSFEKFLFDPLMVFKLWWVIRKYKIDVIHAHNYEGALVGWLAKLFTGRPMLYNAVNSMADELPTYNFIKPKKLAVWLGKFLDSLVPHTGNFVTVVSDSLKDFLLFKGVSEEKLKVVPAGVNLDMFANGDGDKIRQRHGLVGTPIVMYTGTLEQFQRIDYMLQAMQHVKKTHPDAVSVFVGNIPHKANQELFTAMAKELGIEDRVVFVNSVPLSELSDYLAAADVTVVPRPECPGHPVKLLNYMAAGKATVSFEGGAKGLHHMFNGYLVKDHDSLELGRGISFLLERPDIRQTLSQNALNTIQGNFDWETLAKGILIIYQIMLEKSEDPALLEELSTYLRDSYVLRFQDRRAERSEPQDGPPRGEDRRKQNTPIDFIEQRKVSFGANPGSRQAPVEQAPTNNSEFENSSTDVSIIRKHPQYSQSLGDSRA
jgi:glycosyltransferase involved in cell wall biosynthesis